MPRMLTGTATLFLLLLAWWLTTKFTTIQGRLAAVGLILLAAMYVWATAVEEDSWHVQTGALVAIFATVALMLWRGA